MLDIEKNQNRTTHLYMEVYEYYQTDLDGKMIWKQNAFSPQVFPGAEAFPHYY